MKEPYKQCCKEYIEKTYKKDTMVCTDSCPVCNHCLKPWDYLNKNDKN